MSQASVGSSAPATAPPRLVVAGLSGEAGKTLVALGLTRALQSRGFEVAPFKKGPDFIDAAWLGAAAGRPGRNLDTFLMPEATLLASVAGSGAYAAVAVVEGNRGLFDGLDSRGSHSSARLAHLIGSPVALVLDATKVTRTLSAVVLGCRTLDPELDLAAVILNRVGTARQETLIREALARDVGVQVVGAIPKLANQHLPSRHLGLVTATEHPATEQSITRLAQLFERYVDVAALLDAARARSQALVSPLAALPAAGQSAAAPKACIGVLRDRAFSFYYPENLEALQAAGARLVNISPISDQQLPEIDALYAGGGFPEQYADELAANVPLRAALAEQIAVGLPVWAECGGLSYLAEALICSGRSYPMVGALPVVVEQTDRPQGHGYVSARVDADNPFLPVGYQLRGHEFHYSRLVTRPDSLRTALELERGSGLGGGRDGVLAASVWASYCHIHALGCPEWAGRMVAAANAFATRAGRQADVGRRVALPVVGNPEAGRAGAGRAAAPARYPADDGLTARQRAERRALERFQVATRLGRRGRRGGRAGLRERVWTAVRAGEVDALRKLVAAEPRALRHLLGLTYQDDAQLRRNAAQGLGLAAHYHPRLIQNVIRRLVWAMNDESGTNALTAPEVLQAVAAERPELLLPVVPDLVRLAADEGLREGLASALRTVASRCPGQVGQELSESLGKRVRSGGSCGL